MTQSQFCEIKLIIFEFFFITEVRPNQKKKLSCDANQLEM